MYVSWVVRWFSAVTQGFSRLSGFPPLGKLQRHFRSMAVLRGHNGLMLLAAKGALACLLLDYIDIDASLAAIQLLAASKDDYPPKLLLLLLFLDIHWLHYFLVFNFPLQFLSPLGALVPHQAPLLISAPAIYNCVLHHHVLNFIFCHGGEFQSNLSQSVLR